MTKLLQDELMDVSGGSITVNLAEAERWYQNAYVQYNYAPTNRNYQEYIAAARNVQIARALVKLERF